MRVIILCNCFKIKSAEKLGLDSLCAVCILIFMFQNNEKQFIKAAVDVDFLSFVRKGEFVEGAKLLLYTGMKIKEAEDCIPYLVSNISQNWHVSSSDLKQKVEDEIFKRKNGENKKVCDVKNIIYRRIKKNLKFDIFL